MFEYLIYDSIMRNNNSLRIECLICYDDSWMPLLLQSGSIIKRERERRRERWADPNILSTLFFPHFNANGSMKSIHSIACASVAASTSRSLPPHLLAHQPPLCTTTQNRFVLLFSIRFSNWRLVISNICVIYSHSIRSQLIEIISIVIINMTTSSVVSRSLLYTM
jgi:hypothetical protein